MNRVNASMSQMTADKRRIHIEKKKADSIIQSTCDHLRHLWKLFS